MPPDASKVWAKEFAATTEYSRTLFVVLPVPALASTHNIRVDSPDTAVGVWGGWVVRPWRLITMLTQFVVFAAFLLALMFGLLDFLLQTA